MEDLKLNLEIAELVEDITGLSYFEYNWETGKSYTSKGFYNLLGIEPDEWDGNPLALIKFIHEEDQNRVSDHIHESLKNKSAINIQFRIARKNASVSNIHGIGKNYFKENGKPLKTIATVRDITERKEAEKSLHESQIKLKNIIDHSTNLFYAHTVDHQLTFLSPQVREILGYEPEEAMQKWTEFATENPINNKGLELTLKAIKTGQRQPTYELELRRKDGKKIRVEVREAPVVENGKVIAMVGSLSDITERKKAEEALQFSEAKYRSIFQNSALGIYRSTPSGKYEEVNPAFANILGFESPEKMISQVSDITSLYKYPSEREKIIKEFAEKGYVEDFEVLANHPYKEKVWISINGKQQTYPNGEIYYEGTIKDITERKKAEETLLVNQYYLAKAQEIGALGTWELDVPKNELVWTEQNYRNFGIQEGTPLTYELFLECVHPDDKEFVNNEWNEAIKGKPYDIEHRVIVDKQVRWLREKADITFDHNGNAIKAIGFTQDITFRKEAEMELQKYKEELEKIVDERTTELLKKNEELERFNHLFIGREFRIKELKDKVKALNEQLKARE